MPKLDFIEAGNLQSKDLVIFTQGWPDNHLIWDWISWKQELKDCRILFMDFPNTNGTVTHPWGLDFPEIVARMKQTIDGIQGIQTKTMVAHDWGCYYTYMYDQTFPGELKQIISMDVPAKMEITSLKAGLYIAAYQLYLTIAFLIGGRIGTFLTQKAVNFFKHDPPYKTAINSSQNYPYYYLWKNMLKTIFNKRKRYLASYKPSAPIVYMYAQKKPFQFHGPRWLSYIQQNKVNGCEIYPMNAGHWFMKKFNRFITDAIKRRVQGLKQTKK